MSEVNHRLFDLFHHFRQLPFSALLPDGISRNDFATLMCIAHADGKSKDEAISVSTIARKLRMQVPAVSRTIRGLEEKELVTRETDTKDRRNTFVRLTADGKRVSDEVEQEMCEVVNIALQNMKKEDVERLLDYMDEFQSRIQTELEKRKDSR